MTEKEAKDLVLESNRFLNEEFDYKYLNNKKMQTVKCKFIDTVMSGIGESGEPKKYTVKAKLQEIDNPKKIHFESLQALVDQFKKHQDDNP